MKVQNYHNYEINENYSSELFDREILCNNVSGKKVLGKLKLVYSDAVASGIRDYTPITMLLIVDEEGNAHEVRPRDVIHVKPNKKVKL